MVLPRCLELAKGGSGAGGFRRVIMRSAWWKYFHPEVITGEVLVDQGEDFGPLEAAQASAQCGYGHGAYVVLCECGTQGDQAGLDVGEGAGLAPVVLGGQVDDGSRWRVLEDLDLAGLEEVPSAQFEVLLIHGRVLVPELFGESGAHGADAVDGVDEGVGAGVEDIAVDGAECGHVVACLG